VEDLARFGSIPVINGLTDYCHPCQVLADLMTIREIKGQLEGLTACYIGDGNNMANSIIVGCLTMGMKMRVAIPKDYLPAQDVINFAAECNEKTPGIFRLTEEVLSAAAGADVLFTDVWASMGQEEEAEKRRAAFAGYQINDRVMAAANPGAIVQHCLPAHRGEEITAEVFEAHAAEIFEEAENRLHAQKAVMVKLMEKK
jgi:ornithine carbamoyltransferase